MNTKSNSMSSPVRIRKFTVIALLALAIFCIGFLSNMPCSGKGRMTRDPVDTDYSIWPDFTIDVEFSKADFDSQCFHISNMSIDMMQPFAETWKTARKPECRDLYARFAAIFSITNRQATVLLPETFKSKVKRWLGGNELLFENVYNQQVVHVYNKFTHEYTIFNTLRDRRPKAQPEEPEKDYIKRMISNSQGTCDFCNFKNFTAEHVTHRLESELSYTASNTFKLDKWHALFIMKQHHPLNWDWVQFKDLMDIGNKWFKLAHDSDNEAKYPALIWDMFAHAGASQVHPHAHGILSSNVYHGNVELWRRAGEEYYSQFGSNFFTDLVSIYTAMGLAVQLGNAVAMASIAPKKDHEIIIVSDTAGESFFQLMYYTLRAFVDDIEKFAFGLGVGFPAMGDPKGRIPAYARIVTRGCVSEIRSDMSSLELFLGTNVNIDPYKVIELIKSSIQRRHRVNGGM